MIEDARSAAFEELQPGDEKRLFYTRKPWKRVIVMFAGPFMNLILAVVIFLGVLMGFGINTQTTTVGSVSECVISAAARTATSARRATKDSPAKAAGLQAGRQDRRLQRPAGRRLGAPSSSRSATPPARPPSPSSGTAAAGPCTPTSSRTRSPRPTASGGYVEGKYVTAGFLGFTPGQRRRPAVLRRSPSTAWAT